MSPEPSCLKNTPQASWPRETILAHIDVAKSIIRELSIQADQVNSQGNADEYVWMYSQTIHKVDFNENEMQGYMVEAYRLKLWNNFKYFLVLI